MIERRDHVRRVRGLLREFRICAILGARQVGKTTLAEQVAQGWRGSVRRFDLEDPRDLRRLGDPMGALEPLKGLVVLDEIQRLPDQFPVLRVHADRARRGTRVRVLGSAAPDLLRQSSETLAGRIAYMRLPPLRTTEVGMEQRDRLWVRGGFPRSLLAATELASVRWRQEFITAFLERDMPQLGVGIASATMRSFWSMLAHYHGQRVNWSELGRSFGVTDKTVRRYLEAFESTFVVRLLKPWHANVKKRQVKSPKVYLNDPGLLHTLLDIPNLRALEGHPKVGASWEGFALSEVVQRLGMRWEACSYWATHQGAELDLLVHHGSHRLGFEFKRTSAPGITPSMRSALDDLKLDRLLVIHAGDGSYPLASRVRAVGFAQLDTELKRLR